MFFDNGEQAEQAGYRPCKRCWPQMSSSPRQQRVELVARACRRIEAADKAPTLSELAVEAGLSPWHFQRLFKSEIGVSPRQYFADTRAQRFRDHLRTGDSVTDAIFESGFGSSSSAYECASTDLAMTPSDYRAGGKGMCIRHGVAECDLGWLAVAATARGICAIEFNDNPDALPQQLRERFPSAQLEPAENDLDTLLAGVVALVASPHTAHDLPLDIRGTAFRRRVWQALREIPPGATTSYAELAARIGQPRAARAVAGACAANPIAVAVPCHRVLRSDGGLGGYRWGLERKKRLLDRES